MAAMVLYCPRAPVTAIHKHLGTVLIDHVQARAGDCAGSLRGTGTYHCSAGNGASVNSSTNQPMLPQPIVVARNWSTYLRRLGEVI